MSLTHAQWLALRYLAYERDGNPTPLDGDVHGSVFGALERRGLARRVARDREGRIVAQATDLGLDVWDQVEFAPPPS